jgi:hypothetical protein
MLNKTVSARTIALVFVILLALPIGQVASLVIFPVSTLETLFVFVAAKRW